MVNNIKIRYYFNAGVSVEIDNSILIFNYNANVSTQNENAAITKEFLNKFDNVYVFVCNSRDDIFDKSVLEFKGHKNIKYIFSKDIESIEGVKYITAPETILVEGGLVVTAYPSTDRGVSLLVDYEGLKIFNAGTFNLWHWMESSTTDEIREAQRDFEEIIEKLKGVRPDIAFFPLDVRQGTHFEAGAVEYINKIKPRYFVPVRYLDRVDIISTFAMDYSTQMTTIIPLVKAGSYAEIVNENGIYIYKEIRLI